MQANNLLTRTAPCKRPADTSLPPPSQVASKLSAEDKEAIESKVKSTIEWLDANQLAEVEEFEGMQKELEDVCNPIISRMYGAGGEGGMPPGGMPGGMGGDAPSAGRGGPTVEEVD